MGTLPKQKPVSDAKLREALVQALIVVTTQVWPPTITTKLAGQILDRWDELVANDTPPR